MKSPSLITDIAEMHQTAERLRSEGKRIGFVPTMGYLHDGHVSLIRIAREHSDVVVVSIFVNPMQFGPSEDLGRYPRDPDGDRRKVGEAGGDIVFMPAADKVYPDGYLTHVQVDGLSETLEGAARPGHFTGVATVVSKLFNVVTPQVAVFGQKDAQQVAVIKKMVADLNFGITVLVGPIVREPNGLAMSSRNSYLSSEQRKEASVLYRSLQHAERMLNKGESDPSALKSEMKNMIETGSSGSVEYVSIADNETLAELGKLVIGKEALVSLAVRFGSTRLIDNCVVHLGNHG